MGVFSKLFGKSDKPAAQGGTVVEYQSGGFSELGSWSGNIYDFDIVRSAIWANARNAGKLTPKHIRRNGDKYDVFPSPRIKRILTRPNEIMSMSVFIEKMITQCQKKNNAFALIKYERDGNIRGIYPITYKSAEAVESHGFYFVKFQLTDGKPLTVPYSELIHIRAHYDEKDLFGEDNKKALSTIMEVVNTTDKGILSAIKRSAVIRWILKFQNVIKPEDQQRAVDDFVTNYLSAENSGGAAATDPRYNAEQVKPENFVPNAAQMDRAKDRINSYFGVNDAIIQSKYSEYEWNAYYESTLEPFAIQFTEEFTEKILTQGERDFGNEIIFEANRLQYASNTTKISVGRFLAEIGGLQLDQILEIFNFAPLGGIEGKRRVQTLNMVNAAKADEYQLGHSTKEESGEEKESGQDANAEQ